MSFKSSEQLTRLIAYVIVFALVLAIAWWATPSRDFTPHGVLLPTTKTVYPVIAAQGVAVVQGPTADGAVIGTINIEAYIPNDARAAEMAAVDYAKQLAAQAGANQVTITQFMTDPNSKTLILYAQASRV